MARVQRIHQTLAISLGLWDRASVQDRNILVFYRKVILLKISSSAVRKRNNTAEYTPGHILCRQWEIGNTCEAGYLHTGRDEGPLSAWESLDKLCSGLSCIEQLVSKCCHVVFDSLGPHPTPVQSSLPCSQSIQHNKFKTHIRKIFALKTHSSKARTSLGSITCRTELSVLNTPWPHLCILVPSDDISWSFLSLPKCAGHAADLFLKASLGIN